MAQVPYSPVPNVAPSEQPLAEVRVNAPDAAFGGIVGQSLSGFGKAVEGAGDELWKRAVALQTVQNESDARAADVTFMEESAKLHANFQTKQGKDAIAALPNYIKSIKELRLSHSDALPNDATRKLFDAQTMQTVGRTIFNAAGHSATEARKYAAGTSQAKIGAIKDQVAQNPDDELAYKEGLSQIDGQVRDVQAPIAGWGDEQTTQEVKRQQSNLTAARIQSMAKTQPMKAKEFLDQNRGSLYYEDLQKSEDLVTSNLRTTGSRMKAAEINRDLYEDTKGKPPAKGLAERVTEGEDWARKNYPNDPQMAEYTANAIRANYNQHKRDQTDTDNNNRLTVFSGINGDLSNGKMPTTVDELRATSPEVAAAWDNLKPDKRRTLTTALANNAEGDYPNTEDNYRKYHQLLGMRNSQDVDDRTKFLNTDVVNEKLPQKWRTKLIREQEAMKSSLESDPRVTSAMRILTDSGIAPPLKDKDAVDRFRGALQGALEEDMETNKKAPDSKRIREIGSRLIQEQSDPNKFSAFGLFTRKTAAYDQDVPDERLEKIKADLKASNITMTDEQIRRQYFRETYKKLYGGSVSKDKPQ